MKENTYPQNQSQKPASAPQPIEPMTPSPDEVARRAYFTYVNQGSLDGHEVQHWLAAEAELIAERNLTRVHGFHNRT
jgi:hypothetical protein